MKNFADYPTEELVELYNRSEPYDFESQEARHEMRAELQRREPYVGMPVTYMCGSDRYAGKVTSIERNGRTIVVHLGLPHTAIKFSKRSDGSWRVQGWKGRGAFRLALGFADSYSDPSF
jgi:hypothetical protein